MPQITSSLEAREKLIRILKRDTIGPGWADGTEDPDLAEQLSLRGKSPLWWYVTGYLEPANRAVTDELPELFQEVRKDEHSSPVKGEFDDDKHDSTEGDAILSPSCMGLTICTEASEIDLELDWGTYSWNGEDDPGVWKRTHHEMSWKVKIPSGEEEWVLSPEPDEGIRILCRTFSHLGTSQTVSLRLVNDRKIESGNGPSEKHQNSIGSIFQPRMKVSSEVELNDVRKPIDSSDIDTMSVLYRDSKIRALGHNIGVDWDASGKSAWTEWIPTFEVPRMIADEELNGHIPSMEELSNTETLDSALDLLQGLIRANSQWIEDCNRTLKEDVLDGNEQGERMAEVVKSHISGAESCRDRMQRGLDRLREDEDARQAFVLSNRSIMESQRWPARPEAPEFRWRPFQIAFQLLNLNAILATEEESDFRDEREVIDLAWFPTGGGKTEAYLGLIATLGFYRRLAYPEEEMHPSVHAIMRYTLRLLTLDQAPRLVRLVGAMNEVSHTSGDDSPTFHPFRVGMWVGTKSSPNRLEKDGLNAPSARTLLLDSERGVSNHPAKAIMFEVCPWCNCESIRKASNWSIKDLKGRKSLFGRCEGEDCIFNSESGIPFTCVDEDIYNNPPSILLGTADKFVQAAFNNSYDPSPGANGNRRDIRNLLGFGEGIRPPDLVIQDELHLLTGPLGSMAGLLETALDVAWSISKDGHRAKYIAATATIRGAERDARLMFGRELNIFPPPVERASDNFFAREAEDTKENPGRIHASVLGPPKKARSISIQPTASILQAAKEIRDEVEDPGIVDPYWTVVSYYNSLRELGGAQSSLNTQVKSEWIPEYARKSGNSQHRQVINLKELTSQVEQSRLVENKQSLELPLPMDECVDVVLTSNMFQVGIDIERLGLMTITGQPKSNSEYIQSSGRVGRSKKKPGLVVSLLRSTYPRDQSHYENHRSFHQEIYRHVDRTSTTPFSLRALDRALDTTLMALVRLSIEDLSESDSLNELVYPGNARTVLGPANYAVDEFCAVIKGRLKKSDDGISNDQLFIDSIEREIRTSWSKLKHWAKKNADSGRTCHWHRYGETDVSNAVWARRSTSDEGTTLAINSLRDVADEVQGAKVLRDDWKRDRPDTKIPESHLMTHASPGSIWEKDGNSFLTLGIDKWENKEGTPSDPLALTVPDGGCRIKERQITIQQGSSIMEGVAGLRTPPTKKGQGHIHFSYFPLQFRCNKGHISRGREDRGSWRCSRERCDEHAVQMRFISICAEGHVHPFNYGWWVEKGNKNGCRCSKNPIDLEFRDGSAYDLGQWVVRCTVCKNSKSMKRAPTVSENDFDADECGRLGEPWLKNEWAENREPCKRKKEHRQVGSSSVTFNQGSSVLLIPLDISFEPANSESVVQYYDLPDTEYMQRRYSENRGIPGAVSDLHFHLSPYPVYYDEETGVKEAFWDDLMTHKSAGNEPLDLSTIRTKERNGLWNGDGTVKDSRFKAIRLDIDTNVSPWNGEWPVESITRVDRLTELSFITGISRLEDDNQPIGIDDSESTGRPLGIGNYNFGEGIYFEIDTDWLEAQASSRESKLGIHASMQFSIGKGKLPRRISELMIPSIQDPTNVNPFTILHTYSHLLLKRVCELSGYSLSSIKERLFFKAEEGKIEFAGILLYTSGPSSDGTLGGLAGQAMRSRMEKVIDLALKDRFQCSNDPVCVEHRPLDREPNGAACHTCVILPETSCECRNHLLDRNWG